MKILLTGATGFVGSYLLRQLNDYDVTLLLRKPRLPGYESIISDLSGDRNMFDDLSDVKVVIHCAARAHIMNDMTKNPLQEYRRVNVTGTLNLAKQAASAGVRRFIYLSSIKVNGEETSWNKRFRFDDQSEQKDPYGLSKSEAELGLRKISLQTGMDVVIIRPPLVYGPGVKGNFASLLKMIQSQIPLPLGSVNNKRSMVSIQNLTHLILTCIHHPKAKNQTFLVSDDADLSTPELIRRLGMAASRPAKLINVPVGILRFVAYCFGKRAAFKRLTNNLQVDISHTKSTLDWNPPYTIDEGLNSCFSPSMFRHL